jgi:hypothetical protein
MPPAMLPASTTLPAMVNLRTDIVGGRTMVALALASNLRTIAEAIFAGSTF